MKKAPSDSPIWQLKKRELLLPLSFLITKPIKLDLSNLHYGPHYEPHYRTQGCVIRENNITAPITNPIKDTLVPLRTNFNANGSVRWRTSVYLNLFHWPMGKNSGNRNGVCRYVPAWTAFEIQALTHNVSVFGKRIQTKVPWGRSIVLDSVSKYCTLYRYLVGTHLENCYWIPRQKRIVGWRQ